VLMDFRPQQRRIPLPYPKLTKLQHPSRKCARMGQAKNLPLRAIPSGATMRRHGRSAQFRRTKPQLTWDQSCLKDRAWGP